MDKEEAVIDNSSAHLCLGMVCHPEEEGIIQPPGSFIVNLARNVSLKLAHNGIWMNQHACKIHEERIVNFALCVEN